MRREELLIRPLTSARWADLRKLFGERGACGGCWCMWWRRTASDFARARGAGNRAALRRVVAAGPPPGLLAYRGKEPIGWIALAPRSAYSRLDRSRVLKPVDDRPVWSVTCFFVAKPHRGEGLTVRMLRAGVEFAGKHGAKLVEGYPVDTRGGRSPDVWVYTGLYPAFRKAGFREVARRSKTRPIMRRGCAGRGRA